ncbi:MAG TPA: hypothetical protein VH309_05910 [Elusimicrobiota bacterium]|nr:hypothetical protein [Elusimicrobiota bacterium]
MTALRLAAFLAHLPVLGALALLCWQCLFLLIHARAAGLFGLLYAAVLVLLARRAARVLRGQVPRPWTDLVLLLAADSLLGVVFFSALAS